MDDKTLGLMALEIYFFYEWYDEKFKNSLTMDDIEIVIGKVMSKAADLGVKDEHKGLIKSLVLMNMTTDKAKDSYNEMSSEERVKGFMDHHDIELSDDGKII
tara:strand:- start:114 stop:419 length:306 start_codon:yes stop_codon:yes gene_type:complete